MVKFPNISRIVVDCRGLGDAFPAFLSKPWTDPETNKEYPPIVPDNEVSLIHNALPILHPVIANNTVNQQMVSATTIAFEQKSIELPVSSRLIIGNRIAARDGDADGMSKNLTMHEKAIFVEADALQVEMGNIVGKEMQSGAIIYDVAKSTQHKDRYSALGMALKYISEVEDIRKKKYIQRGSEAVIGIVTKF